jgi:hypothetical protein
MSTNTSKEYMSHYFAKYQDAAPSQTQKAKPYTNEDPTGSQQIIAMMDHAHSLTPFLHQYAPRLAIKPSDNIYNRIEMLLINHSSNLCYVTRRSSSDALSLAAFFIRSFALNYTARLGMKDLSYDQYQKNFISMCIFLDRREMRSSRNIGTFSWALSEFIPFNRRLL